MNWPEIAATIRELGSFGLVVYAMVSLLRSRERLDSRLPEALEKLERTVDESRTETLRAVENLGQEIVNTLREHEVIRLTEPRTRA